MLKLSKPSKMPCRSWSLEAKVTCPASVNLDTGEPVDACEVCYARDGFYNMPTVKALRQHNKQDWKRDDFVSDFIVELNNDRYFRWFDSGDCYSLKLAWKLYEIMQATPWCNHWFPTRQHKFTKFAEVLDAMEKLPNVVVRYSSDSIEGDVIDGSNSSTIIPYTDSPINFLGNSEVCLAYERSGKCGTCRSCWDKDVQVIAYPAHGRKAIKLIKLMEAA